MKHILIVDDDKMNLLMAKEALCDLYKITAVTKGSEAIKFLERNTCDLILLDINMPEMDGFEVMSKIKEMEQVKNIPIIFLTADNEASVESRCLEEGAQDFIAKPFVKQVVISRIGRIIELEELRASLEDKLEKKTQEVIDITNKSQKDVLTGLWNRTYIERVVDRDLSEGNNSAIFMIDLDNFKSINDTFGHVAGDNTLKMFAETLEKYAEEKDVLCRIGGDEFVVYIGEAVSKEKLANKANDIIIDLATKLDKCGYINCSVSIGIAVYPSDGGDFSTLYNAADKALYHVKFNGKNSYHFYSDAKKVDSDRSENTIDLEYIKELMERADNAGEGNYNLDFDNLHHIYNFLKRFVKRSSKEIHAVLFTAVTEDDGLIENEELEEAMKALEEAICISLRSADISTRYSNKQMMVILLDANKENSRMVVDRILSNYHLGYKGDKVHFSYGIAEM